ncbi:MAG: hypothetical protein JSR09_02485 [Bacteroidetes bacterium]|nr:hypothetical protein [Bacteroidota bacterium]MBS1648552.1 hypothetical protein [Bacteroidota bacterium]
MFNFFKKNTSIKIINKVYLTEATKWEACEKMLQTNPNTVFITWFEETYNALNNFLEQHCYTEKVVMYRQVIKNNNVKYFFVEHYPLYAKEEELFTKLGLNEVVVMCSLDEAFLKHFGSEKIIDLLEKLGMNKEEVIEHEMISSSIKNAQTKLAKQVLIDNAARSQTEWFRKNLI